MGGQNNWGIGNGMARNNNCWVGTVEGRPFEKLEIVVFLFTNLSLYLFKTYVYYHFNFAAIDKRETRIKVGCWKCFQNLVT